MNNTINLTYSWEIFEKYVNVMNTYLNHFITCNKFVNKDNDRLFLLINGFSTLTNVFKIMLKNTLNVDIAIEKMEKSIYYYTQFVEQIEENLLCDLNVSSNSASIFVYKKTINTILFKEVSNTTMQDTTMQDTMQIIKNLDYVVLVYRSIFDNLIKQSYIIKNNHTYNENHTYNYSTHLITKLRNASLELCINNKDETNFLREITNVMLFMNHFADSNECLTPEKKYDYTYLYIKKYKHFNLTLEGLYYKKIQMDYNDKLEKYNINHYIKWLVLH